LNSIYKQEKPDLVHHFTIKPAIFGSIAAKWARVPVIVNTITGLGYVFEKPGLIRSLVEHLYRFAFFGRPNVIFQNRDDFHFFLSKGLVRRGKAHIVLGSGVNTELFRPARSINSEPGLTFLLISRMLWSKGISQFVVAAERIKKDFPNTRFIMVGGFSGGGAKGNPDAIPEDWLRNANQKGYVRWLGRVPLERVITLLDNCDVFVLPSYYSEGVPRSLIEAAAKGKAIITTDTPGCREVVRQGVNGFLVSPKDTDSLTTAMTEFIRKSYLIKKMGKLSRKRAIELFDEKKVIQETMMIYKQVGAL
jgi:glycosyltransferase involved in cell wall biosynthesis